MQHYNNSEDHQKHHFTGLISWWPVPAGWENPQMVVVQVRESPQKAQKSRFRNDKKIWSDSIPFIEYTLPKTNSKSPLLLNLSSLILKIYFLLGSGLKWPELSIKRTCWNSLLEVDRRCLAPSEAFCCLPRHEIGMVIWCFQGVYVEYAVWLEQSIWLSGCCWNDILFGHYLAPSALFLADLEAWNPWISFWDNKTGPTTVEHFEVPQGSKGHNVCFRLAFLAWLLKYDGVFPSNFLGIARKRGLEVSWSSRCTSTFQPRGANGKP